MHQAALLLSISRARTGVMYPCRWPAVVVALVCGRPLVGKPGFRTESVATWAGTVVCPAS